MKVMDAHENNFKIKKYDSSLDLSDRRSFHIKIYQVPIQKHDGGHIGMESMPVNLILLCYFWNNLNRINMN